MAYFFVDEACYIDTVIKYNSENSSSVFINNFTLMFVLEDVHAGK